MTPNNSNGTVGRVTFSAAIVEKLTEILKAQFPDDVESQEIFGRLQPLVAPLVNLALVEGYEAAEDLLVGLATADDTYPFWERLITRATPEERLRLMQETEKAALEANVKKAQAEKRRWDTLMLAIRIAGTIIPLLL